MLARSSSVIPGGRGSIPGRKRGTNRGCCIVGNPAVTRRCRYSLTLPRCHSRYQICSGVSVRVGPTHCSALRRPFFQLEHFNWSMQTTVYYPKAEFIETVSFTSLKGGEDIIHVFGGQGHGEQSLASRDDFRTSEHHPRREDDHFKRCYHPRRFEACWPWTRRRHISGALLSRGGGVRHEVRLKVPPPRSSRSDLIST
jgi:hypothetical protein